MVLLASPPSLLGRFFLLQLGYLCIKNFHVNILLIIGKIVDEKRSLKFLKSPDFHLFRCT